MHNCLSEISKFSSLIRSGKIPTSDIYIKPPLVNGKIHDVTSPASLAELKDNAKMAPNRPKDAVQNCENAACLYDIPDFNKIAKSLISCGTS